MKLTTNLLLDDSVRFADRNHTAGQDKSRNVTVLPDQNSRLVFLTDPNGLAVEQYKMLRRRLCSQHPLGGLLMVTSPSACEGKTLTSINLAWCLADGGLPTCLVDLDFRSPGVAPVLAWKPGEDAVEEVLSGRRKLAQALRPVGDRPLHVLGIQQRFASPAALLRADVLGPMLKELRAMFGWVILDLPPAIPMADVAEVLPHVDGALLVVRSGKTEKSLLSAPIEILGSKLWGAVLNEAPIAGSAYYGTYGDSKR